MTNEQKKAHERLQAVLPCRTHFSTYKWDSVPRNVSAPRRSCTTKQPVIVSGVRYESMREAEIGSGIKRQNIYRRIHRGWEGYAYAEN